MVCDTVGPGNGSSDEHGARIEGAVRHLVRLVRGQAGGGGPPPKGVLLDMRLEGVRCRIETAEVSPNVTYSEQAAPPSGASPAGDAPVGGLLSPRETEVAIMVAQGYPNKAIAAVLQISSFTVSSYLRRIFAKLGVNSRAAMVAQALEHHLLPEPLTRPESNDIQSPYRHHP